MSDKIKQLIRLNEWTVDEKRRKLGELLSLMADLEAQLAKLENDLVNEQMLATNSPSEAGFLYGNYAKAVVARRDNLKNSIMQMEYVIEVARDDLADSYRELKKYEETHKSRERREKVERERKEQTALDEVAINTHRRKVGLG